MPTAIPALLSGTRSAAMPAMPAMPGMPNMPGFSGGAAGPSTAANGPTDNRGGYDGSNWAVNFGGQTGVGTSVPIPAQTSFVPNAFGLPTMVTTTAAGQTVNGGGVVLSPLMMAGLAIGAFLLLRRRG